jgi:hypothetical protein
MHVDERIEFSLSWLRAPIAGISTSGIGTWLAGLNWGSILMGLASIAAAGIGLYYGWLERRDLYLHRREMRLIELAMARAKLPPPSITTTPP